MSGPIVYIPSGAEINTTALPSPPPRTSYDDRQVEFLNKWDRLRSQNATSNKRGGSRYNPNEIIPELMGNQKKQTTSEQYSAILSSQRLFP